MKKLSTALILIFIFITFTSCSKSITLQTPKEELPLTKDNKENRSPKTEEPNEIEEIAFEDKVIKYEPIKDNTPSSSENKKEVSSQTETPILNEDRATSLEIEVNSSEPITKYYYSFGFINEINLFTDKPTLIIDEAEFYMYDEALKEAIKDDKAFLKEDGTYTLMSPYYIRNNYDIITTYPISENCLYYVCMHVADDVLLKDLPNYELSSDLFEVNLEDFIKSVDYYRSINARILTWFDVENGQVVKLHQQYVP